MSKNPIPKELSARFQYVRKFGKGGGGDVFLVIDRLRGENKLVLKIIKGLKGDEEKEYVYLSRLAHPNLARVYDSGSLGGGRLYFTQEYVRGVRITDFASADTEAKLRLANEALGAISYLHKNGIIHRDIKPSHLLVTGSRKDLRLKIIDFGLAEAASSTRGEISGTIPYLAPEILRGGKANIRSDIYSLGLVLFKLFTGRAPFHAGNIGSLIAAKERGINFIDAERKKLHAAIVEFIRGLCDAAPEKRFSDATEAASFLVSRGVIRKTRVEYVPRESIIRNDPVFLDLVDWVRREYTCPSKTRVCALTAPTYVEVEIAQSFAEREWQIKGGYVVQCDVTSGEGLLRSIVKPLILVTSHLTEVSREFEKLREWAYPETVQSGERFFRNDTDIAHAASLLIKKCFEKIGPLLVAVSNFSGASRTDCEMISYLAAMKRSPIFVVSTDSFSFGAIDGKWLDAMLSSGSGKVFVLAKTGDEKSFSRLWADFLRMSSPDVVWAINYLSIFGVKGCPEDIVEMAVKEGLISFESLKKIMFAGWLSLRPSSTSRSYQFISPFLYESVLRNMDMILRAELHLKISHMLKGMKEYAGEWLLHAVLAGDKQIKKEAVRQVIMHMIRVGRYSDSFDLLQIAAKVPHLSKCLDDFNILSAKVASFSGNPEKVISFMERVKDFSAKKPDAALFLSSSYLKVGRHDDAKKIVAPLLKRKDNYREKGLDRYFRALLEEGKYSAVTKASKEFKLEKTSDTYLCNTIGLAHYYLGDFAAAILYFKKAEKSRSDYVRSSCINYKGMCYYNQGYFDQALECFEKASSEFALIWHQSGMLSSAMNKGVVWHARAKYGHALKCYEEALQIAARTKQVSLMATLLNNLANIYIHLGAIADGLAYLDRATRLAKTHGMKHIGAYNLLLEGEAMSRQDELDDAVKFTKKALVAFEKLNAVREMSISHLNLGRYYVELLDCKRAREELVLARKMAVNANLTEQIETADILEARVFLCEGGSAKKDFSLRLENLLEKKLRVENREQALEIISVLLDSYKNADKFNETFLLKKKGEEIILSIAGDLPYDLREKYYKVRQIANLLVRAEEEEDVMKVHALAKLLELNRKIMSELNLEKLLSDIMDAAITLTGAERGFVIIGDGAGGGKLDVKVARNLDKEDIKKAGFKISRSIAEKVMKTGIPLLTTDAQEDARFKAAVSVHGLKLRSVVSVPLKKGTDVIGAVYLDNRFQKGIFSEDDLEVLSAFADQANIALENARLYSENLKKQKELEAKQIEIRSLNEKLESIVAKQSVELESIANTLELKQKDLELKYNYHNIIGKSAAMQAVFHIMDRVTDTESTVLITGESGTGKELVAHAIHYNGSRKKGPFLSINCAAIPETLLESELFGHKKGSFTGATFDRAGLFEKASNGSIFLDEIGEMPLSMQAKLLRVLQDGKIRRVGTTEEIKTNVRIIAATNRDMAGDVKSGRFREDLYYRLNVLPIKLPRLAERKDDVPILIENFLEKEGMPSRKVSPRAMKRLLAYNWPGNIRELQNVIERARVLSDGDIQPEHLPNEISMGAMELSTGVDESGNLKDVKNDLEKRLIGETLIRAGGNKTNTAKILGLSRYGLYKKIKRYHLE